LLEEINIACCEGLAFRTGEDRIGNLFYLPKMKRSGRADDYGFQVAQIKISDGWLQYY
jgi:hypothetical protein